MPAGDDLLATIEAVYAAGYDCELWPDALRRVTGLFGSNAATLETFDARSSALVRFWSHGVPPAQELDYFDYYAANNPRAAYALRRPGEPLVWDYRILDEAAMDRDPYYSEFLAATDLRYFLSGDLVRSPRDMTIVSVQRSRRQGHVAQREIALMQRLIPHLQNAVTLGARLAESAAANRSLESALDALADGIALLASDGAIRFANEALATISRRNDGLRIVNRTVEIADPQGRARYAAAFAAALRLMDGDTAISPQDFPLARPSGAQPLVVGLRPLARRGTAEGTPGDSRILLLVRDPETRGAVSADLLREVFGLTAAEAALAQALQSGTTVGDYSRANRLSLNTVYTHLRRIKEKTGSTRMGELVRRLGDVHIRDREGD